MSTQETKLSLRERILAILKLDDNGKLEKFFKREVKVLNEEIETIEMNKQSSALELKSNLSKIDNQIEDSQVAVDEAYEAVTIEDLKSNESMTSFSEIYWNNIERKEAILENLTKERVRIQERYDENLKGRDEKIAKRNARISKIS